MHIIVYIYIFALGTLIGSFINVCIDRIPRGLGLGGRSACDHCGRPLTFIELVPILSLAMQGFKSRCCRRELSATYTFYETLTGVLFLVTFLRFESQINFAEGVTLLPIAILFCLCGVGVCITGSDFATRMIPDRLQIALLACVLAYKWMIGGVTVGLLAGGVLCVLPIFLLYFATGGRGMGYADVKLQFTLGLFNGVVLGFVGLYFAFLTGAIYGVYLLIARHAGRKTEMAFGPFLLLGAYLSFMWGDKIVKLLGF